MAIISSQSTRTDGAVCTYAKKDPVAISAINASVPLFEERLREIRIQHGKDGYRPRYILDESGKPVLDANGNAVPMKDSKGNVVYEAKYVQAYPLVQSFGPDELDPNDPASWERAQELGRALAEDQFNGHPVLVSTEVNGRSGCVHNHIIVGAINIETGKSIDSNIVTHSRLALAHDRVLAEQGHQQRDDMVRVAEAAAQQMEDAKAKVLADIEAMPEELRPSETQREKMLVAAEKGVKFQGTNELTATQQREAKRMREYGQYILNEQSRGAAHELGIQPERERFSEIVLEERVKAALADPRYQSWDDLKEVGQEYGVSIERTKRGNDVTYGMLLQQPDGSLLEPARAHRRRGGSMEKQNGLGEEFWVERVELGIQANIDMNRSEAYFGPQRDEKALAELEEQREFDAGVAQRQQEVEASQHRVEAAVADPQMLASIEKFKAVEDQGVRAQLEVRREIIGAHGQKVGLSHMATALSMPVEEVRSAVSQATDRYGEGWRELSPQDLQAARFEQHMAEAQANTASRIETQAADAAGRQTLMDELHAARKTQFEVDDAATAAQSTAAAAEVEHDAQPALEQASAQPQGAQLPPAQEPEPAAPANTVGATDARSGNPQQWQSGLRGVEAKSDSEKVQARIDGLAQLEEDHHGRELVPDAEFEQRVKDLGGVNAQFMHYYGLHMGDDMRQQLTLRVAKRDLAKQEYDQWVDTRDAYNARRDELREKDVFAWQDDAGLRELRLEGSEHAADARLLRHEVDLGDYADHGTKHLEQRRKDASEQKMAGLKKKVANNASRVEGSEQVQTPQEKAFANAQRSQSRSRDRGPDL